MKKKAPKYYVAQMGTQVPHSGRYNPSALNLENLPKEEENPNLLPAPAGTPESPDWQNIPGFRNLNEQPTKQYEHTGNYIESPLFKALNAGIVGTQAIANEVNSKKANDKEVEQYLRAIAPVAYSNNERYGLNANPVYTQYGGSTSKYQVGGQALSPKRTFGQTASQFVPFYETYLDVKDIVNGAKSGDTEQFGRGVVGLGQPFAGKALSGTLDYATEKTLGKSTADYNEQKRNDILNMSTSDRIKLFQSYGAGGYDEWSKAGKPKLQAGGNARLTQNASEQAAVQAASGNSNAPVSPIQPLTAQNIKKKYKSNPFVTGGREAWGEALNKEFPISGGKVKDTLYNVSRQSQVNPALLYGSAMEEGMNLSLASPDDASDAYVTWADKNKDQSSKFPIDGFYNYGLDRFGEQYKNLQKKGYLPEGFDKRFTTFDAANEKKENIKTAAFDSDEAALMAKAAMIRDTRDQVTGMLKKKNINLSDKATDFFTLAGYNGGLGNAQKMIDSYNQKGYLKDDKFLEPTFKPASYGSIYSNVQKRLQNANVLQQEGAFDDYNQKTTKAPTNGAPEMQMGGSIKQAVGLPNKQTANVEAERGEAFMDNNGEVMQVADDENTHEQGGVMLSNVDRVLENTSTLRSDKNSKYLKLEPQQIKAITGLDARRSMSHAEALVKANENNEKLRQDIVKKIELAGKDRKDLDKFAENSTKLNLEHFKAIPTTNALFDKLFDHQELIKQYVGITNDSGEAQNGGSVRDYLDARGMDGSFASRKKLFGKYFDNYTGTAEQNTELLRRIKSGDIVPNGTSAPTPTTKAKAAFAAPTTAPKSSLESGVVVDKRSNEAHVIKGGKVVKSFPVLTGQNPNGTANNYSMAELEANPSLRATPAGGYNMTNNENIYGMPGYNLNPLDFPGLAKPVAKDIAMHKTYNPAVRSKYYTQPSDHRAQSYGCINCEKPDMEYLNQQFPKGDTLLVIDPKKGQTLKSLGIQQKQLGGYTGNKTGMKTPAGNSDAFPATENYKFEDYLKELETTGFKYEGIKSNADLQKALYDYKLQKGQYDDIRNMWSEGMHQTGMAKAKELGFVDNTGKFKQGVLDNNDNLKKLGELYPDNKLGVRLLKLAKGAGPRIWTDDDLPQQPTAAAPAPQKLDTSITNTADVTPQPKSKFNEPLRWYDVASPIGTFLSAERIPEKYNPVEFNQLQYKQLDPTAALEQNQADFNAAINSVQNTSPNNAGVQMANIANLTGRKYSLNNQVLGNYENQNAQIKNNEITYNTQVRDKQSIANQQAREVFESKVLESKAKQQEQKLTALDSLYKTIADNKALNRNGNLMMKFSKAFDQYGDYNGYQTKFQVNPALGIPTAPKTGKTEAAGGITGLQSGKTYYNRKTGKTLYFNGTNLVER